MSKFDVIQGHEPHPKSNVLSDIILGGQDGLVNVLGIVLGVSAATTSLTILYVAALAAAGAETISMAAVAYTSTRARRRIYLSELEREKREMEEVPKMEREEVRVVFKDWGYKGKELEHATDMIVKNPKAWLEFMMAHELHLAPVEKSQPLRSFAVVGAATVIGSIIPLLPYVFISSTPAAGIVPSVIISGVVLFLIGLYEARLTAGRWWSNGLQLMIIGLVAGLAGYLIGHFVGAAPI